MTQTIKNDENVPINELISSNDLYLQRTVVEIKRSLPTLHYDNLRLINLPLTLH